jgi:hypothetical protein
MAGLKLGSKGEPVVRVQQALLACGYSLPKWGADGDLGAETWSALVQFAHDRSLEGAWPEAEAWTGTVPQVVLDALIPGPLPGAPEGLVDLTRLHRLEKGRKGLRDPKKVTGIVLHQTATKLGNKATRWYDVACHVGIPPGGAILYVNDILSYVWHANAANRFSVGIEIDGRFEGVLGDHKTRWNWQDGREADVLSAKQIAAARDAVRWLVDHGRSIGCPMTHIYAHRQFSDQRRSDPGSQIWTEVALWAKQDLGLKTRPDYTIGTGLAIPTKWDPQGKGPY